MAAKKKDTRPCGPPIVWSGKTESTIMFTYFLICDEIRKYYEEAHPAAIHPIIAYLAVLRSIVERHPVWPRNAKFQRSELAKWSERVHRDLDIAAKPVSAKYREEFKAAIVADLDYLSEFMDRKRDPATDV